MRMGFTGLIPRIKPATIKANQRTVGASGVFPVAPTCIASLKPGLAYTVGTQRSERLMAEMMAFSELVTMEVSMPTPHTICVSSSSPIWHST